MKTILTQDEYQNQFVDFYKQTLGTGIGTSVAMPGEDEDQDDGGIRRAPSVPDTGGGDAFNPMAGVSLTGGQPYNYSKINASDYVKNNMKSAKASLDKSDGGFTDYLKNLAKDPATVPLTAVGVAMGLPLAPLGAVMGKMNKEMQYKNALAIASSGGGYIAEINGQTVSRAPGSKQYVGSMGNFSSEQLYALEELGRGYIPGTMVETYSGSDDDDGDGTYSAEGKEGLLDAATAKALGGNYDAYGNWHSTKFGTVSRSAPIDAAKALASQMGVNTAGWATTDFVNFSKSWKDAAAKPATSFSILGGFSNIKNSTMLEYKTAVETVKNAIKGYTPGGDSSGDDSPPPPGGTTASQDPAESGSTGVPSGGYDYGDYGGYEDEPSDNNDSGGGVSFGGGTSMDASGYGGDSTYGALAAGGRVGMQAGGVAAQPAGFVQGPPGQFSDRETVADDQPMKVAEGTFVINAPAVEHAGSQDIRKMILDAYTIAREKGLDIGRVDRKIYESTIDVALSKGEVVVPPQLAKIIGYDRLEKINNRGKKEVSRRQQAARGGFLGLAEGGTAEDPLGISVEDLFNQPEDSENYEDRIILDEVQRKMEGLVKQYEDKGVIIDSFYTHLDPKEEKASQDRAFTEDVDKNATGPFFSTDDAFGLGPMVNVPRTPNLLNLFILAEEFAHQGASKRLAEQQQTGMSEQEARYAEELRAKRAAFETVRGLLPQGQRSAEYTLRNYGENFIDHIYETSDILNRDRILIDLMKKYPELEEAYKQSYGKGKGLDALVAKVNREEKNVRKKASGGFVDRQGYASGDKVTVYRGEPIDPDKAQSTIRYGYDDTNVGKFHTPSVDKARRYAVHGGPGNQQILSRKVTIDELFEGVEEAWKVNASKKNEYFAKMPKKELDKNVRFVRDMKKAYLAGERSLESMVFFLQEQVFHDDKSKVNFIETFKNDPKSAGKLAGRAISKVATKATPPLAILEMIGTVFAPKTMGDGTLQGNESFLEMN